ncbi:MAG TPA: diguanylate cyclase [Tepiditoga sp.]|nr:diguanylate cyclase [Thermotogota bacterium]HOO74693.1 diguanylate cyclase [Tepiditoga sp.]
MGFIYSSYVKIANKDMEEKINSLLSENGIEIEHDDIFNSDFAIVDQQLSFSFPHVVVTNSVSDLNTANMLKNETIDFVLPDFDDNLIQTKIQNSIYFVNARGSRGAFKQRLIKELEKIQRSSGSFSIAMISIMNFYEHEKYLSNLSIDDLSKETYKMIKMAIRKSDEIMKISRKEFGILLPYTELRNAEIACERIKRRAVKIESSSREVKLAFGITEVVNPNEDIQIILERLKKALYMSEGNNGEISYM